MLLQKIQDSWTSLRTKKGTIKLRWENVMLKFFGVNDECVSKCHLVLRASCKWQHQNVVTHKKNWYGYDQLLWSCETTIGGIALHGKCRFIYIMVIQNSLLSTSLVPRPLFVHARTIFGNLLQTNPIMDKLHVLRCIKDWLLSLQLWGSIYHTGFILWSWYLVRAYLPSNFI